MIDISAENLIRIAHLYYPRGLAVEDESYDFSPEVVRRKQLWAQAIASPEAWKLFLSELTGKLQGVGGHVSDVTAPYIGGCRRCCISVRMPEQEGGSLLIRVAGCVSLLAPVYTIYGTTQHVHGSRASSPQLFIEPTGLMQNYTIILQSCIERRYGYRRLPPEIAATPISDIRAHNLDFGEATIADAFFTPDPANLP